MKTLISSMLSVLFAVSVFPASSAFAAAESDEAAVPKLNVQQGKITLPGNAASLNVPKAFGYLDPAQARQIIVDMWGNPAESGDTLGMVIPTDVSIADESSWAVIFQYSEEGHIADDDAKSIDYAELLKKMQHDVGEENEERKKAGYAAIDLVGWAEPPHYDQATHKLYWAKNLKFAGSPENTLNYCIRALGRRGVLELNVVAPMSQLAEISKHVPEILAMVDFNEGNRYADFDPKVDKLAVYGIGALIAGKVALKVGFLKMIIGALIAMKKLLIIAVVAVGGLLKKVVGGGRAAPVGSVQPPTSPSAGE